jgi:hypothetical protein
MVKNAMKTLTSLESCMCEESETNHSQIDAYAASMEHSLVSLPKTMRPARVVISTAYSKHQTLCLQNSKL